jgi:transcriptional antiterminator NusG
LAGLEGELVHVNGKSKVAVRLTMLGCACVDIPAGCVEPVSENGDLRD